MADTLKSRNPSAALSLSRRPIGVFDSGLGGLTIVREIRRRLPEESIVYFGDIARLPYGIKSVGQIRRFSIQNSELLRSFDIKALVIACNSSSSAAYSVLKNRYRFPVVDVLTPAVEAALTWTRTGRVGVIGTRATVASGAYERALRARSPKVRVESRACPMFVPLAEEGWTAGPVASAVVRKSLASMRRHPKMDTVILGCTHYPMLKTELAKAFGRRVRLIDSASPTVKRLEWILEESGLRRRSRRKGTLRILVSDLPGNFVRIGERFLGEKMKHVRVVRSDGLTGRMSQ